MIKIDTGVPSDVSLMILEKLLHLSIEIHLENFGVCPARCGPAKVVFSGTLV